MIQGSKAKLIAAKPQRFIPTSGSNVPDYIDIRNTSIRFHDKLHDDHTSYVVFPRRRRVGNVLIYESHEFVFSAGFALHFIGNLFAPRKGGLFFHYFKNFP